MRSTDIITAFIQDGEKFLILKRSSRVKTMKGLWAAVSGIIESNEEPLSRARIEIYEELGIRGDEISLVRSGDQIMIISPQYKDHQWRVFPFLFSGRNLKVTLNWENSEYRWATRDEISKYKTVPRLNDVLVSLL